MIKLFNYIFGSELFELDLEVPVEDAIENFNLELRKRTLFPIATDGIIGYANKDSVKIGRVMPIMKNVFKPFFIGKFISNGNQSRISGYFRLSRSVQLGVTFSFGFFSLWIFLATLSVMEKSSEYLYLLFSNSLMLFLLVGLLKIGENISKDDKQWIKGALKHAVSRNS